jgi:hypothetical protein
MPGWAPGEPGYGGFLDASRQMCTQLRTLKGMTIETLSVREAREQLPSILERFRSGDRKPVGVGSHRKTEAIMVPVEVFNELTAGRMLSLSEATASLLAEGLVQEAEVVAITERWAHGEISTAQMRELVRKLYGGP